MSEWEKSYKDPILTNKPGCIGSSAWVAWLEELWSEANTQQKEETLPEKITKAKKDWSVAQGWQKKKKNGILKFSLGMFYKYYRNVSK
jgi:hypothetical protein